MSIERELKFLVQEGSPVLHEEGVTRLRDALAAAGFATVDQGTVQIADRYYDDPRLSLSRAGLALRRRIGEGRIVATLKTRGETRGAMHVRDELELPMEGRDWPAPILERVSAAADPGGLKGRFELETVRRRVLVTRGSADVALLAIDRVAATRPTGGRSVAFTEVEVEDLGGGDEALERVRRALESVVELEPSDLTKLERARSMLMGQVSG